LFSSFGCGSGMFVDPIQLPTTGTYTIVLDPSGAGTGQATTNVYSVTDTTQSITVGGSSVVSNVTTPGQVNQLTFSGTAGQRISVNSNTTFTTCWTLKILKPDTTQLFSSFGCGSGMFVDPQQLPTTGTYTIVLDPSGAGTGSATTNAYNVTDVSGSVTINGSAFALTTTVPGQNGNITFSGTSGQLATVRIASSTLSCVTVTLVKPDGTTLTSVFTCSGTFNLTQQTLPATGTYTIKVDPNSSQIGSANVSVTNP